MYKIIHMYVIFIRNSFHLDVLCLATRKFLKVLQILSLLLMNFNRVPVSSY